MLALVKTPLTVKSASTSCAPKRAPPAVSGTSGEGRQTCWVTSGPTWSTNTGIATVWPCRLVLRTQIVEWVVLPVHFVAAAWMAGSAGLATSTSPASGSRAPPSAFAFTIATTVPIFVPGAAVRFAV